mgnify:CR=1 FL=1|jgi:5-methylcytosine-specific restriction endonuclease McrA
MTTVTYKRSKANPTGRDADPRRTIPLQSARWQRLRRWVLDREPLCRECRRMGHPTPATDVDHVSGNPADNSPDNLQALCHACHSAKTVRERHGKPGLVGNDSTGWPVDPAHPWNVRKSPEGRGR